MLRWIGFLVLVVVVHRVLTWLPILGPFLAGFGFLGFWVSAIVAGFGLRWLARRAYESRRYGAQVRELAAVDSPRNQGKLGSLYATSGRLRRAVPLLEAAVAGEPDSAEWKYQLGRAYLGLGQLEPAITALDGCVALNEEHAYGSAVMRLAEAHVRASNYDAGLDALARFERNHGPSPESAYRRGDALRRAGRKDEARAAFATVADLARTAPRYQRTDAQAWVLKARLAGLF